MTLSPQFLDELRARTLLSSVIAPSVKLIRAGREYKACCPFHQEKTPSFTVNDEKGFYHCFGCGAHGDVIRFLTDARGLPFMDAVKELAAKAGMEVPAPDPQQRERAERSAGLTDVMAAAQAWFAEQLAGSEGGEAREYLARRGIDQEAVKRFGLGFAPAGRTRLKTALASLGEDKLVETGMLIRPEDGGDTYDRFRGRLMIPIRDARGRVIAFGGRILGPGEPKYLNSPETVLFDKGRTLYNLDRAGPASRQAKRLVVVEGYMDVIALDRAGIAEAVAPNGTAVTEAQLERMWRLDSSPILCFDGDSAGQKAAVRTALRALPMVGPERTLRFVALPAGQDPDDLVRSGGPEAIEALLAEPESLADRIWRHEQAPPLTTPEARAALKKRVIEHAETIRDPDVRAFYRRDWLDRLDILFARPERQPRSLYPRRQWKKGVGFVAPPQPTLAKTREIGSAGIDPATARAVIYGHALFPEAIGDHVESLASLPIADRPAAMVRDRMIDLIMSGQALDRQGLATILQGQDTAAAWRDVSKSQDMRFTFTRVKSDPGLARRDLGAVMDALLSRMEIETAFDEAIARFRSGDDTAFEEQQKLHAAREAVNDRLASLAGNE